MRQLAFDLPLRAAGGRAAFFVAPPNAAALAAVDGWRDWPAGRLLLIGPAGAGKSHLAEVWRAETGAALVRGADLAAEGVPGLGNAVVVEAADTVAGTPAEVALFHLINLMAAQDGRLLLTARAPVRDWGVALPDLASRLHATAVARIEPPDEGLLAAVLVKHFADRQIAVSPTVIAWLVPRMERSLDTAAALVARLDAAALARGGAITRALAAEVLDSTGRPGEDG